MKTNFGIKCFDKFAIVSGDEVKKIRDYTNGILSNAHIVVTVSDNISYSLYEIRDKDEKVKEYFEEKGISLFEITDFSKSASGEDYTVEITISPVLTIKAQGKENAVKKAEDAIKRIVEMFDSNNFDLKNIEYKVFKGGEEV